MSSNGSVLVYGDTVTTPEMRREISHGVNDPFLYFEHDGIRRVVVRALEIQRMREVPNLEAFVEEDFGLDGLAARDLSRPEIVGEIALAACRRFGITSARVPDTFPIGLADRLRAGGVELIADQETFLRRQRSKTDAQVAGVGRAQRAAEAAVGVIAGMLRDAVVDDGVVTLLGEPLTTERLKLAGAVVIAEAGAAVDDYIVAHGPQTCIGHHMGSGVIRAGEPITVDLGPHDPVTGCHTDMTRTFVVGEVSDELRGYHALADEALRRSVAAVAPGLTGSELHDIACEVFEAAGHPTLRTKEPGTTLLDGFFHTLGHGVGLKLHEAPTLGPRGAELVTGDVLAIEPGCYRQGYGGVRLEDVVLVTESGAQTITDFRYGLEP